MVYVTNIIMDNNGILEGVVKFRDRKKWKSRWCVMRKLSPVADCLHLQLYRDSRDRYRQGQTKASLSLQHFLGVETGFTLDNESNTIAIICQDLIVVLAFDTRERLIQWQVKIASNLGEGKQFLVLISQAPSRAKISTGPARLHVQEARFCMTSGVPPRLIGFWEIGHLRRYGVIEGRFCFEGGSRCGRGEGLYVLMTDQGAEITRTLQLATQGKLSSCQRQAMRKSTQAMNSPKKLLQSRQESRVTDVSILQDYSDGELQRGCPPYWSAETTGHAEHADSTFGDAGSVHTQMDNAWPNPEGKCGVNSLERCVSCISKLGASTLSRSSTANAPMLCSPAWTMEPIPACTHQNVMWGSSGSDRISVSSNGTVSSGNSECSAASKHVVPLPEAHPRTDEKPIPNSHPPVPPKSNSIATMTQSHRYCSGSSPPSRPPKPTTSETLSTHSNLSPKQIKKPPMPLPFDTVCCLGKRDTKQIGCDYDVPKSQTHKQTCNGRQQQQQQQQPLLNASRNSLSLSTNVIDYYDTPKSLKDSLPHSGEVGVYANYDMPPTPKSVHPQKPCGCILTISRQATDSESAVKCTCQHWIKLSYSQRGERDLNTTAYVLPISKVKLNGEGKMPVVDAANGGVAIYATIDKSKKVNKRSEHEEGTNYENLELVELEEEGKRQNTREAQQQSALNYENIEFAHSLEYYENAKDLLQKTGINQEKLLQNIKDNTEMSFSSGVECNTVQICTKCGHQCKSKDLKTNDDDDGDGGGGGGDAETSEVEKLRFVLDDYLEMEPSQNKLHQSSHSGYLPMFPGDVESRTIKSHSESTTNLTEEERRKSSESESARRDGSPSMMAPGTKEFSHANEEATKNAFSRKRSSSADSSCRHPEEFEGTDSRDNFLKTALVKNWAASNSLVLLPAETGNSESDGGPDERGYRRTTTEGTTTTTVVTTGSAERLVLESVTENAKNVSATGNNRDSSSSNDSGVSTTSLKQRQGRAFRELSLMTVTTEMSPRPSRTTSQTKCLCLHASLPRRSKSSDPLREFTNFHHLPVTKLATKYSSAGADFPISSSKKGHFSPGDAAVPFIDSRSTSSGTSDMSDYIETLSLSSHSSSDAPDASLTRIISKTSVTALRPRSGNEYHKIDRSFLNENLKV